MEENMKKIKNMEFLTAWDGRRKLEQQYYLLVT